MIPGHYDRSLVFLSVVIAITSTYAALHLTSRMIAWEGKARAFWLAGGAVAMGTGIWAMHFVGMLALRLPVATWYDLPTVGLSLVAAILASAISLQVVSRAHLRTPELVYGSLSMGAAISAMHYIGMAALRMPGYCHYDPQIVCASILIAVLVSGVSLWITFRLRKAAISSHVRIGSAIVMGLAIAGMHYTGMAAAFFERRGDQQPTGLSVGISSLGTAGIAVAAFLVLFGALASSLADRYLSLQRTLLAITMQENQLLLERNMAAVVRTTPDGDLLDLNDAALRLLGHSKKLLLGTNINEYYADGMAREQVMRELNRNGHINGVEICLKRSDGSVIWVLCNLTLTKNLRSGEAEILTSATDISALKNIQQELIFAREQAEQASLVKSRFVANMSHELRTPLNGILGTVTLALGCELPINVRSYLEICKLSADSLMAIVNDVLDFSKIEAAKLKLDLHEFDLWQLLNDTIRVLSISASQKNLQIVTELPNSLPRIVIGDSLRFRQVLLNIAGNAIKFTPRGTVTVSLQGKIKQNSELLLKVAVKDTGIGIPQDKIRYIFEAFAQADTSDTRKFGGTGLGLAISSELVNAMGGRISVASTVGVGSTFSFSVVLRLPHEAKERPADLTWILKLGRVTSGKSLTRMEDGRRHSGL